MGTVELKRREYAVRTIINLLSAAIFLSFALGCGDHAGQFDERLSKGYAFGNSDTPNSDVTNITLYVEAKRQGTTLRWGNYFANHHPDFYTEDPLIIADCLNAIQSNDERIQQQGNAVVILHILLSTRTASRKAYITYTIYNLNEALWGSVYPWQGQTSSSHGNRLFLRWLSSIPLLCNSMADFGIDQDELSRILSE